MLYVLMIVGRIKAIQLDYSEAHRHLLQAMRKAPQHTAVGFKQTVSCFDCKIHSSILLTQPLAVSSLGESFSSRHLASHAIGPFFLCKLGMQCTGL